MYQRFGLALLLLAIGCAGNATSPSAAREASENTATTADAPRGASVPQDDRPLEYPEKADVQRLLVRAAELESNGKFQDALTVTRQAVSLDPSSPRANAMQARLEELLRRIRDVPGTDERMGQSKVAQRTAP